MSFQGFSTLHRSAVNTMLQSQEEIDVEDSVDSLNQEFDERPSYTRNQTLRHFHPRDIKGAGDIEWSKVPMAEYTKQFRCLKEMVEDTATTMKGRLTTFRIWGARIQWFLMVFNFGYILWKWIISPERDPTEHFNLSELTVTWVEFLICNVGTLSSLLFIKCGIMGYSNGLKILKMTSLFNTFKAIQIFNASNTLFLIEDEVPDYCDRLRWNWEAAYEHKKDDREQGQDLSKCQQIYDSFHRTRMNFTNLQTWRGKLFVGFFSLCIGVFLLFMSGMSLAVKIKDLMFVGHKAVKDWSVADVLNFFGLFFQIASIATHDPVQVQTALNYIFWNETADYGKTEVQSQKLFRELLTKKLIKDFGFLRGLMVLDMTLNEKDLYRMWIKNYHKRPSQELDTKPMSSKPERVEFDEAGDSFV